MRNILYFLFVVCLFGTVSAQNREVEVQIVSHQVKQGETVRLISKKYLVSPSDIYRLNKFAVDGISSGMVLQIPVPVKETVTESAKEETMPELTTEVDEVQKAMSAVEEEQPKETPKKEKTKPVVKQQEPVQEAVAETVAETSSGSVVAHKVKPGETLNGLAKKYGITVNDIKSSNEKILKKGLQAGQTLQIPAANGIVPSNEELGGSTAPKAAEPVRVTEPVAVESEPQSGETIEHKVAHGETLYSISRKYGISVDEIKRQNEKQLAHGLQTGQTIKITPTN